ncbi:unnamed protein product [Linum tenue]|uniref:2-oxoglutarate-dependent dioxygenase DAO n=2 Tax=Linum tenue TaxID=586396 RepID=A0AAV0MEG7_9ROSI|nr:unnamed protein product [Linum tenue]
MVVPTAANGGDQQKPYEIPFFDLGEGDNAGGWWRELCDKVREACETHGCFCFSTERIPSGLRQGMVEGLRQLFELPEDTKKRHVNPKPYRSYLGKNDAVPYLESFGIDHAPNLEQARAFTTLMWPQGNPSFCEAVKEMSGKMQELNLLIMKMLFTSYGLDAEEHHAADTASYFRLMKYKVPPTPAPANGIGLVAHTDKNTLTILGQNDVQGLEIQPKNGGWVPAVIPDGAFIAIVGDTLKAWSNGRLHPVRHRVVIRGEEERYSWGSFLMPKDDSTVAVADQLVDGDHPLMYRPFTYSDYLSYFVHKLSDDALEVYAGLSSPVAPACMD